MWNSVYCELEEKTVLSRQQLLVDINGDKIRIMVTREDMTNAKDVDEIGAIRVLLVSTDEAARDRFNQVLSGAEGVRVVGQVRGGDEALIAAQRLFPDIILLITDVWLPEDYDLYTAQAIAEAQLPARIIFITDDLGRYLAPAIKTRAAGLLPKSIEGDELLAAMRKIYRWSPGFIPLR